MIDMESWTKKRVECDEKRHFISMRVVAIRWIQLNRELSENENRKLEEEEKELIDEYSNVTDEIIALELERLQEHYRHSVSNDQVKLL